MLQSSVIANLLLIPSNMFFSFVTVFLRSAWLFLILSNSLFKFSLSSSIPLSSLVRILMTVSLNFLSGRLLFIFLGFFPGDIFICFVPSFES